MPAELLDAGTPATWSEGAIGIGSLDCEGLSPGPATVRLAAHVRLLAGHGQDVPAQCFCNSAWVVQVGLDVNGQTLVLPPWQGQDPGDESCRRGPDETQDVTVMVDARGRLQVRLDLLQCARGGPVSCLFLGGTQVSVFTSDGGVPLR